MNLQPASGNDLSAIFRETFSIWSPGLTRDEYCEYMWRISVLPWAKRHLEFLVLKAKDEVAASLKYNQLTFRHRSQSYKFVGLGAVYTQTRFRNQGYASQLMELAIDKAVSEGADGMFLFSDIDPAFYTRFGFVEVGNQNVHLMMARHIPSLSTSNVGGPAIEQRDLEARLAELNCTVTTATFGEHPALMLKHYRRWLHTQLFGVDRDEDYFAYKLWKENFLSSRSRIGWPRLELIIKNGGDADGGYALTEHGGRVLRVLELVGTEGARIDLWRALRVRAQQLNAVRISSWESILQDLNPGFSLNQLAAMSDELRCFDSLTFTERARTRCMILPIKIDVANWALWQPCPILELDHL
jgi:Predicted acetyltransferase involved in intracellular survival and related acetyltransferases